jgi:hypothetical protein
MFGLYTPLLALQAFCLYHAYRHSAEQRWYWLIIFIPVLGCAFYLYDQFYNRASIRNISQGVKEVVNSNYRIEQLEKALRFADNVTNKINLADAYMSIGRYTDAAALYQECAQGFMADDPMLRMKILQAFFLEKNYAAAINIGRQLEGDKTFKNSEARIGFAWSTYFAGDVAEAEKIFSDLNKSFTNYPHRVEYCRFLKMTDANETLRDVLAELLEEFDHMKGPERRLYRNTISTVRDMARAFQG